MTLGNGLLVEAEPGGARVRQLTEYSNVYYCRNIAAMAAPAQLQIIADAAKSYVGVPYSFLDYTALALHRFHLNDPELRRYIATSKHMICSQLCDQAYSDASIHLFANRWEGYVTPGDLYCLDVALGKTRGLS